MIYLALGFCIGFSMYLEYKYKKNVQERLEWLEEQIEKKK
jgi:hypothetical protein